MAIDFSRGSAARIRDWIPPESAPSSILTKSTWPAKGSDQLRRSGASQKRYWMTKHGPGADADHFERAALKIDLIPHFEIEF